MYSLIEIRHNIPIQLHGNQIEVKKLIDILSKTMLSSPMYRLNICKLTYVERSSYRFPLNMGEAILDKEDLTEADDETLEK